MGILPQGLTQEEMLGYDLGTNGWFEWNAGKLAIWGAVLRLLALLCFVLRNHIAVQGAKKQLSLRVRQIVFRAKRWLCGLRFVALG